LAKFTEGDACNIKALADLVAKLSPKLAAAVVKIEESGAVKIIVGSADVYAELYSAVVDLDKGDYAGVGIQLGVLLGKLSASGCANQACLIVQGILEFLQQGFADFDTCKADVENTWNQTQLLFKALENKQWPQALNDTADVMDALSASLTACGVAEAGTRLSDFAHKLHHDSIATAIADMTQVLVSGVDITPGIEKLIKDVAHEDWVALGRDIGGLVDFVTSGHGCQSFVCKMVEGWLELANKTEIDLKKCEPTLRLVEADFTAGAALWGQKQLKDAIKYWASGLNMMAKAVADCNAVGELDWIKQEANSLGLGNITFIDEIIKVLVHGTDFYEVLYQAMVAMMNSDFRTAGKQMGIAMNDLSEWTRGHLCTSDICYVVSGVLEFLSNMNADVKACAVDFKGAYGNFSHAVHDIVEFKPKFRFTVNKTSLKAGVADMGKGLVAVANAVGDCHMGDLSLLIMDLAIKLGIAPEISWIEELISIMIKAVPIEHELSGACQAFADENWPAFGYNLMMLWKTLAL